MNRPISTALQAICDMDRDFLTPDQVSQVLGWNANDFRVKAHLKPELIPFPVYTTGEKGRHVKVPRIPFLEYMGVIKDTSNIERS